nr:PREDICTED: gustatory receptor for sugar taste 43a-like isoform X2 [Tribolium castaneum]|eukprot:XP_015836210.1 PREDICTED: gustatory receptor for sugar taste 43a-like isoform X2 [Tribolium castaneum]
MFRDITLDPKFFHCYQPIFTTTRFLGLNPLTCHRTPKSYLLKWSWTLYSFNCVLIAILTILGFYGLESYIKAGTDGFVWSKFTQNHFLSILDFAELQLLGFYFVVVQPFGFKHFAEMMDGFGKIDSLFPDFESENERRLCIIFGSGVFVVFSMVLVFDGIVVWRNVNGTELGLKDYTFYLVYFVLIGFELQYWQLVGFIERRMRRINKNLKHKNSHRLIFNAMIGYEHIYDVINWINKIYNIQISVFFGNSIHNNTRKFQLIISSCFLRIVLNLYVLILSIIHKDETVLLFLQVAWILLYFIRFVIILEVCHSCELQHQKTLNLIFTLITRIVRDDTKDILKNFSLKLTQNKIRFCCFAIPRINRSLFVTICSSITTFLIIFIQFTKL